MTVAVIEVLFKKNKSDSKDQRSWLKYFTFYLTLVSDVLSSCGLAETACISDVFLVLLAKATFIFLWITSVSGVPTFCPGLDAPPGVSNSPSETLKN